MTMLNSYIFFNLMSKYFFLNKFCFIVSEFQSLHLFYLFCITEKINSPLKKGVRGIAVRFRV
jgi:hypothetical protein